MFKLQFHSINHCQIFVNKAHWLNFIFLMIYAWKVLLIYFVLTPNNFIKVTNNGYEDCRLVWFNFRLSHRTIWFRVVLGISVLFGFIYVWVSPGSFLELIHITNVHFTQINTTFQLLLHVIIILTHSTYCLFQYCPFHLLIFINTYLPT